MKGKPKTIPVREVETLPEVARENELIYNKSDESFYIGIDTGKEEKTNGNNVEKTSV